MSGVKSKNIACWLFLLYIGYYAATCYFVHTHIYQGVVYVHSHPYKKAKNEPSDKQLPFEANHQHSAASLFSLNQISNLISTEGSNNNLLSDIIRDYTIVRYKPQIEHIVITKWIRNYNLRAPPYSIV